MSKKITRWKCSVCGEEYKKREEADECEKQHVQIAAVKPITYMRGKQYPHIIDVQFENGAIGRYGVAWINGEEVDE